MVLPSDMAGMRYMTSYYIQSNRVSNLSVLVSLDFLLIRADLL